RRLRAGAGAPVGCGGAEPGRAGRGAPGSRLMITAVDLPVLLDVLIPGAEHGPESEERLAAAARAGALVICPTVAAELGVYFTREVELKAFLRDTGLKLDPF